MSQALFMMAGQYCQYCKKDGGFFVWLHMNQVECCNCNTIKSIEDHNKFLVDNGLSAYQIINQFGDEK